MSKLQRLGDLAMWPVIVGVLSVGLGIMVVVGLLVLAKDLFLEWSHEADSTDDERDAGTGDVSHGAGRRCAMTP